MKQIEDCEKNLDKVSVKDFHELCWEHHKEGRTGRIRFPKRLRDLHRKLTKNYSSDERIITSQLIDIMNNGHLEYCNKLIMDIGCVNSSSEEQNG